MTVGPRENNRTTFRGSGCTINLMPRKSWKQHQAAQNTGDEAHYLREGYRYRVLWSVGGLGHGPLYDRTLEDASARQDRLIKENEKEIPLDYYSRQARVIMLTVSIEEYMDGRWVGIKGAEKECVWDVKFAD